MRRTLVILNKQQETGISAIIIDNNKIRIFFEGFIRQSLQGVLDDLNPCPYNFILWKVMITLLCSLSPK
jgi:hypothetical protein